MGNSYCKMNYSKGAVNVVKNTHIKPQKIERIWLWQVFVWSVNLEKNDIVCCYMGKTPGWCCFLSAKTNITFFGRFVIKLACRVQIWKKIFCQNSDKFGYSFIKSDIMCMFILYIYKKKTKKTPEPFDKLINSANEINQFSVFNNITL